MRDATKSIFVGVIVVGMIFLPFAIFALVGAAFFGTGGLVFGLVPYIFGAVGLLLWVIGDDARGEWRMRR